MMMVQAAINQRSASDKQTLSLKRKRPPSSGPAQPISGGFLEYWAAAFKSSYASILKMMITQSKTLANSAAVDTLLGQAPDGVKLHRNALLVDISCRNAVKSAEAISSLVVTSEARVPKYSHVAVPRRAQPDPVPRRHRAQRQRREQHHVARVPSRAAKLAAAQRDRQPPRLRVELGGAEHHAARHDDGSAARHR